jgi:phosphatidylglycerol:prolipoprotein diacylglycerol transferase
MNGIVININPVIGQIGGWEIRWYSLAILAAIAAAVTWALFDGRKKGISSDDILSALPWVLIGGIAGARVFHVFDHWSYYAANPWQIIQVQQGGLAIWGALVGGGVAVIFYTRIKAIPVSRLADVLAPGLLMAQIIGRLGCIVNGDAFGGPTNLPWGFIYTHPNAMIPADLLGIPTHPYPVYDMLWNGLALVLILKFRNRFSQNGMVFLTYAAVYALGRFILSFVRQENIWFWDLQEAQVVALGVLICTGITLVYLLRKNRQQKVRAA